jgi:hypothetical protein
VNIAYATIEALRSLVPRDEWTTTKNNKSAKKPVAAVVAEEVAEETK